MSESGVEDWNWNWIENTICRVARLPSKNRTFLTYLKLHMGARNWGSGSVYIFR